MGEIVTFRYYSIDVTAVRRENRKGWDLAAQVAGRTFESETFDRDPHAGMRRHAGEVALTLLMSGSMVLAPAPSEVAA